MLGMCGLTVEVYEDFIGWDVCEGMHCGSLRLYFVCVHLFS